MTAPALWLEAGAWTEARLVVDSRLEVVAADELLLAEELVDELDELLAAPPPRATDVAPFAELSVKSASTVCEIVPLVTFAVR
ncbi:MAG TPA: hypothetical protein VMH50_17065 [Thermoleophilia bacterium]|nr:hypothetical protein [Thermoleophilia bacterium]